MDDNVMWLVVYRTQDALRTIQCRSEPEADAVFLELIGRGWAPVVGRYDAVTGQQIT